MSLVADPEIARAAAILRAGGLVAFPTETVYGLGADASSPTALRRMFAAKGRPADHPVIVHLAIGEDLTRWSRDIPAAAQRLADHFWPGPLTLVLKRTGSVLNEVTGGQDTVGLRMPVHPIAQSLLRAFGGGIAAPSANRFGRVSPTTAQHVRDELGGAVDLILDGGACEVGIESTIVDVSSGSPILVRPGRISATAIERVTGQPVSSATSASPRAPGTLAAHYAPKIPLRLATPMSLERIVQEHAAMGPVAVLARRDRPPNSAAATWQVAAGEPGAYAHDLYALLRFFERSGCALIVVEAPPRDAAWDAVRDRLTRAAAGSGAGPDGA
jgi:L-threonylcarbamoyladenylate synthase